MKKRKLEIDLKDLQLEPICGHMDSSGESCEDHGDLPCGTGIPNFIFDAMIGPCA